MDGIDSTRRKPITLTHKQHRKIVKQLIETYGQKITISFVCRRELGFTFREHQQFNDHNDGWRDKWSTWYVDFYSEEAETMFRLQFL